MNGGKYRIRFQKAGDLRFLSHHDLIRLFERLMRRAGLPIRSTGGFHPLPKMVFASALGLGIVGRGEIVEIELQEALDAELVAERLAAQCPAGLSILSAERIGARQQARVSRVCYRLPFVAEPPADLAARIAGVLHAAECRVERSKPQPRTVDIRPFIRALTPGPEGLVMEVAVTAGGSARPEEVLRLLGLQEMLNQGAVLERMALEIDEPNHASASGGSPNEPFESRSGDEPSPRSPVDAMTPDDVAPILPKGTA